MRAIDGQVFLNTSTPSTFGPSSSCIPVINLYSNGHHKPCTYLASDRVEESSLDTKEGHSRRARLGLNSTRQGRDDNRASLSLEECVDDGGLLAADVVVQPVPRLGVDGLADGANDTERAQVGLLDMLLTETTEETDSGRGGVEVRQLVLVDRLPEARRSGVDGRGLEHGGGDTVCEWAVDEVAGGSADRAWSVTCAFSLRKWKLTCGQ